MSRHSWEEAWAVPQKFTILVVDDEVMNIQLAFAVLKDQFRVIMATSGEQALEICRQAKPDLVLMDVMMAGMSGLEVCKIITSDSELEDIPVIFLTGLNDAGDEVNCWNAGCVDFIVKPFHFMTLRNRVKVHLMLKYQKTLLKLSSSTDGLTGLYNRVYFQETLQRFLLQAMREQLTLSLFIIDVDYFKQFNDSYGHVAGDEALKKVALALRNCCVRPMDVVARYGGEEFVLILPETDQQGAAAVSARLHREIAALNIAHQHAASGRLTVSAGCFTLTEGPMSVEQVVKAADMLLYQSKEHGRSQTTFATSASR